MAVLPHLVAQAALAADLHVQVEVAGVEIPAITPGVATVTGRIVRVFRGDAERMGKPVLFQLHCEREQDVVPGGPRTLVSDFEGARILEVFLFVDIDCCVVNSWLCPVALAEPTDTPRVVYKLSDAQEKLPKRSFARTLDDNSPVIFLAAFFALGLAGFGVALWAIFR